MKKYISIWIFLLMFAISGCSSNNEKSEDINSSIEETAGENVTEISIEDYLASCIEVTNADIARNPQAYIGKDILIEGSLGNTLGVLSIGLWTAVHPITIEYDDVAYDANFNPIGEILSTDYGYVAGKYTADDTIEAVIVVVTNDEANEALLEETTGNVENTDIAEDFQAQEPIELDYGYIYGGIIDMVLSEVSEMGGSTEYLRYTLYDIDKDGYLEFFMEKGTCEADMSYVVYSTNGNVAIKLGEIHAGHTSLFEYKSGNGLYTDYGQMGYEVVNFVWVENGTLKEELVFEGEVAEYGYNDGVPMQELQYPMEMYTLSQGPLVSSGSTTQMQENDIVQAEYIFPDSNQVYYNEQALFDTYSYDTLRYGKNEIYARHGYIFNNEEYRNYFESMTWYQGTISSGEFDDSVFNEYEKHNIQAIQSVLDYYEN